jgi:hypothetical protein
MGLRHGLGAQACSVRIVSRFAQVTLSSWSYVTPLTAWPVTNDEFNQPIVGAAIHIMGTYSAGGELQRDDTGVEFVPQSTYWTDADLQREWLIARGHLTVAPALAERIRKVAEWDDAALGFGNDKAYYT